MLVSVLVYFLIVWLLKRDCGIYLNQIILFSAAGKELFSTSTGAYSLAENILGYNTSKRIAVNIF